MDFSMDDTAQLKTFRREVREWLNQYVPQISGSRDSDENYQLLRKLGRQLGAKGWLYPTAPPENGGGGMSGDLALIIARELGVYDLGLPPCPDSGGALAGQCIAVWGNDEQKRRILPRIIQGEAVTWLLATGPEGGSDFAATATTAKWDGDQFVINGVMTWVQGSHPAEYLWTIVKTGPEGDRYQNLSWFMIPGQQPGIRVSPMEILEAEGQRGGGKNTVYLENVHVTSADLIGGLNSGWRVAQTFLALKHGMSGSPEARDRMS